MNKEKNKILAMDMGGTQFRIALANEQGKILKRFASPIESPDNPERGIEQIMGEINELLSGVDASEVRGMGVAIAGLITPETGILLTSPNLLEWYNTPIKDIFEEELKMPVWVGNDANMAAVGERRFGAGKGIDDLIYITVSTGVGGGIIIGGKMLVGSCGFGAEIGHMTIDVNGIKCNCGNVGCLETLASGTAIARMAIEKISEGEKSSISKMISGDIDKVTSKLVYDAASDGDAMAADVMLTAATYLGVGVVNLVHLFNPTMVIIGGGVSRAGDILFRPVRQVVAERAMRDIQVEIVPAGLRDDPGLLGAVAMVLENT